MSAPSIRFLRPRETVEKVGLCNRRLAQMEAAGKFPKRVRLSPRASAHLEHEVEAWMQAKADERSKSDAGA